MKIPKNNYMFHVHTYRCKHAFNGISDEDVIEMAISLGKDSIYFTDHAPFPENPFGNRMDIEQLPEYLSTLSELREKYQGRIDIHIGLEIEYIPSFDNDGYYRSLLCMDSLEFLMLGQHMAEVDPGEYTFSWDSGRKNVEEYKSLAEAEIAGIKTGYFDVVAHPDRLYKRCRQWTADMDKLADRIIEASIERDIILEQNMSSMRRKRNYWAEFWDKVPADVQIITGYDAHSIEDMSASVRGDCQ